MSNLAREVFLLPTVNTHQINSAAGNGMVEQSIYGNERDGAIRLLDTEREIQHQDENERNPFIQKLEVFKLFYQDLNAFLMKVRDDGSLILQKLAELELAEGSSEILLVSALVKMIERGQEDIEKVFLIYIISQSIDDTIFSFNFLELISDGEEVTPQLLLGAAVFEDDDEETKAYPLMDLDREIFSEKLGIASPIVNAVLTDAIELHRKYYQSIVWNQTREPIIAGEGTFEVAFKDKQIAISILPDETTQDENAEYITQRAEADLLGSDQQQIGQLTLTQKAIYDWLEDEAEFAFEATDIVNQTEIVYLEPKSEILIEVRTALSVLKSETDTASLIVKYQDQVIQELPLNLNNGFEIDTEDVNPELVQYLDQHDTSVQSLLTAATAFLDFTLSSVEKRPV